MISLASMGNVIVMTAVGDSSRDSTLEVIDVHDPAEPCDSEHPQHSIYAIGRRAY